MDVSPGRRRRSTAIAGDLLATTTAMKRSSSSSSSSEINVAQAQPTPSSIAHTLPLHRQQVVHDVQYRPAASSTNIVSLGPGCLILQINFFTRPTRIALGDILHSEPRPIFLPSASHTSIHHERDSDDESENEPNAKGTYSKAYKLRHPEIQWSHRGQGRYVPTSSVKAEAFPAIPAPIRNDVDQQVEGDSYVSDAMISALRQAFDDFRKQNNPNAREKWSPSFKHQFRLISELIQDTPRSRWNEAATGIKLREHREVVQRWIHDMGQIYPSSTSDETSDDEVTSRPMRRSNAMRSIEHRRSSRLVDVPLNSMNGYRDDDDDEDMSDASEDSTGQLKTFPKSYVDNRPREDFYHAGNGWYKRGSRPTITITKESVSRRGSTSSNNSMSGVAEVTTIGPDDTLHGSDLRKYPGQTFHHAGNGWYKIGPATNPKRSSTFVATDGSLIVTKGTKVSPTDPEDQVSSEIDVEIPLDPDMIVDKAFTLRHPEIEWVHRGNGRYKSKSSVFETASATPSDRRSSRADVSAKEPAESIEDYSIRGSARAKRASRAEFDTEADMLFDKAYVLEHPHEEFHHRGQGKWARGPRSKAPSSSQHTEDADSEGLVDSAYTLAHPQETFYHRGQGKWARGLPPLGTSNKVAIRGPGAKDRVDARSVDEEDDEGNRPPGLTALVRREEGPERWPNLKWVYRGGGKWCRTSKEELERLSKPPLFSRRSRLLNGRGRHDGPEAQLQREAQAANAVSYERTAPPARRTKLVRHYSDHESPVNVESIRVHTQPIAPPREPSPRPPLLPPEEDRLLDEDLPALYKEAWSSDEDEETSDEASKILRMRYAPMNGPDAFVKALTKHDPAVRSLDVLTQLAFNAQTALRQLQDEYLEIDKLVAQNPMAGKKERKPVKGGRQPVETTIFEDKKEACLYDYVYDARRNGYQNPQAQKIIRDAEGRELRRRRGRNTTHQVVSDQHMVNIFDEVEELTGKRVVKPVSRFDGLTTQPPRKKSRLALAATSDADGKFSSFTTIANNGASPAVDFDSQPPSRTGTPVSKLNNAALLVAAEDYKAPTRGRWKNHIPKRIRELRGESVGSSTSARNSVSESGPTATAAGVGAGAGAGAATGTPIAAVATVSPSLASSPGPISLERSNSISSPNDRIHKGRPLGSKNLHRRLDAGIKKGPRKPKLLSATPAYLDGSMDSDSAATSGDNMPGPATTTTMMMAMDGDEEEDADVDVDVDVDVEDDEDDGQEEEEEMDDDEYVDDDTMDVDITVDRV